MFSLAGIPPLAGFWGKMTLFYSAVARGSRARTSRSGSFTLAVIGALNAAIAAAYYLRIIGVMYFDTAAGPQEDQPVGEPASAIAASVSILLLLVIGFVPGQWIQNAQQAEIHARRTGDATQATVKADPEAEQTPDQLVDR